MAEGRTTQEQLSSNSLPIATIRNAARRKRQRAIQVVATHPAGEFSISIEHDIHQQVNTPSKRSTAGSRFRLLFDIPFMHRHSTALALQVST